MLVRNTVVDRRTFQAAPLGSPSCCTKNSVFPHSTRCLACMLLWLASEPDSALSRFACRVQRALLGAYCTACPLLLNIATPSDIALSPARQCRCAWCRSWGLGSTRRVQRSGILTPTACSPTPRYHAVTTCLSCLTARQIAIARQSLALLLVVRYGALTSLV